ncbi:uncharacterized protein LOC132269429 [Cornus florida]|uniref:uncharacterized protein LOC132269429 n=1 Tax=Cornus florida TaxID=4283 RepID=UPI00289A4BCA|nr:uncharacterized protein LOC132269429 [Cornus florida]XP_059626599.1 uncharacterized protein LOC132269429 [Cornus florida]
MNNLEEHPLVSEIKDKEENALEVKKQEAAVVDMKNEENAIEEENNELNAIEAEEESEETASEEEEEEEDDDDEEEEVEEEENALVEEEGEENGIGEEENAIGEGENEEKAEKENSEKKTEVDSKKRTKKPRRSRKKKVARRGPAEENAIGEEENEEKAEEENNEKKTEVDSKKKAKKPRRSRKKEVTQRGPETVTAKGKDKPESSGKKNTSKKAESMGMIFMCSSKTKKDCYQYKVLGLPASKRDIVQKVYKGMRLFLYDIDLRLMYGIYKAAGPGGYNLEPKAFKSAFPSQVRFKVMEDCLPLAEEKFKKVIKDNYFTKNKFDCQLNSEQVKNLCKLFNAASKGSKSNRPGRSLREETRTFVDRDRIRRRARDEEKRHSALVGDRRYHERPVIYEREAFASPVAPLARVPTLPPPVPAPSYAYGRTVDAYGWDPLFQHHDRQLLELESRRRGEIERRDPYISYREPPSYRDPLYSANLPPEYNRTAGLTSEYRPHAGLTSEYRPAAGLPPDYNHHHQPFYRY